MNSRLPDFFIIGAQKCGTTSLYHWLNQHSDVFMPKLKEPHYFSTIDTTSSSKFAKTLNIIKSHPDYQCLFKNAGTDKIIGEASPSYLWDASSAEKTNHLLPRAKIVVSLRDPVERAYSEYLMLIGAGLENRDFLSAIKFELSNPNPKWGADPMYISLGKYGTQLQHYYNSFHREQIFCITLDKLANEPQMTMKNIGYFLEINNTFWNSFEYSKNVKAQGGLARNQLTKILIGSPVFRSLGRIMVPKSMRQYVTQTIMTTKGKKASIGLIEKEVLWDIFEPEIIATERLIGRKLPALWLSHPDKHIE